MESPGLLILRIHIDLHVHQRITILADIDATSTLHIPELGETWLTGVF